MFLWIRKNIGSFFLALLLAIGVWAAAVNASDPNEELLYPGTIPVEIVGQNTDLLITNAYAEQIKLTLRAPRSIWSELIADKESIHIILDLAGLDAGEHSLVPQVQIGIQPTRIISLSPATIDITLEELSTRTLPIEIEITGEPSIGFQTGSLRLSADEATISGPKSLVEQVSKVRASYNLNDAREDIDKTLSLDIVDAEGKTVRGVDFSPEELRLRIPINQQGGYRDMIVKVGVVGEIADLYRLTNISFSPLVVTIYSTDAQLISALPGVIETESLDIEGLDEDIAVRLKLILPENVSIVGDQSVLVKVSVEAILGSLTLSDKPLEIINLDPALFAEFSPLTVNVIVSGPLSALDAFSADDLRVTVDAGGLSEGDYQLTPLVEILNDKIKVESILPESITITISKTPFSVPTETP